MGGGIPPKYHHPNKPKAHGPWTKSHRRRTVSNLGTQLTGPATKPTKLEVPIFRGCLELGKEMGILEMTPQLFGRFICESWSYHLIAFLSNEARSSWSKVGLRYESDPSLSKKDLLTSPKEKSHFSEKLCCIFQQFWIVFPTCYQLLGCPRKLVNG